jgi:hypothetical protein
MKGYDSGLFKKGNIYICCFHVMKACRRFRGMTPLILNLGSGWSSVVNFTPPPPAALPPGKYPASIENVAEWTLEPVWTCWRKVAAVGIRTAIHD